MTSGHDVAVESASPARWIVEVYHSATLSSETHRYWYRGETRAREVYHEIAGAVGAFRAKSNDYPQTLVIADDFGEGQLQTHNVSGFRLISPDLNEWAIQMAVHEKRAVRDGVGQGPTSTMDESEAAPQPARGIFHDNDKPWESP